MQLESRSQGMRASFLLLLGEKDHCFFHFGKLGEEMRIDGMDWGW